MSNDPDYVASRSSYMKRVATKCRICGLTMFDYEDCKQEMHVECKKNYKKKTYGVR